MKYYNHKFRSKISAVILAAALFLFCSAGVVFADTDIPAARPSAVETVYQPDSGYSQASSDSVVFTAVKSSAASSDSSAGSAEEESGSQNNSGSNAKTVRIGGIVVAIAAALGAWLAVNREKK